MPIFELAAYAHYRFVRITIFIEKKLEATWKAIENYKNRKAIDKQLWAARFKTQPANYNYHSNRRRNPTQGQKALQSLCWLTSCIPSAPSPWACSSSAPRSLRQSASLLGRIPPCPPPTCFYEDLKYLTWPKLYDVICELHPSYSRPPYPAPSSHSLSRQPSTSAHDAASVRQIASQITSHAYSVEEG